MFENVTWPVAAVYNLKIEGGAKMKGKAEVDVVKGPVNKLLKRREEKRVTPFIDYATEAADRISTSG